MKMIGIDNNTRTAKLSRLTLGLAALALVGTTIVAEAQTATNAPAPPPTNAPAAPPYGKRATWGFWKRLDTAEVEQAGTPSNPPPDTNAPPSPARRIGAPPFDSPPYPDGDWQLGGGPNVIGDPGALRDSPWPLMQALYDGPNGKALYDSRIQLYGWWTVSGNVSSSHNYGASPTPNFPQVYDERSDRVEMDQFVAYLERMPDMNQTDHVDWGFRLAFLYGLDYRFMASRGYLNDQNLLVRNSFYGFDTPMMYFNFYFPKVAEGMELIVGRIISLPDIEQQLAPNNLMASHSLVYSFDDYTTWGIFDSIKLNKNWVISLGLLDGVDIAPWEHDDPGDQPTGSVMVQYIGSGGHDSFYVGMNSFNNGTFGFNNLQECVESYTHKFNDKWWTTTEGQYMWTTHCTEAPTRAVPVEDGFYPTKTGYVWAGGVVNYTCFRFAPNAFLTVRNEWWDDPSGYRSGYSSSYDENAIGVTYWPTKLIMLRPEVRFDHSFKHDGLASSSSAYTSNPGLDKPFVVDGAYDGGTKQSQITFAVDITYHF
jgi:hypothetical protein